MTPRPGEHIICNGQDGFYVGSNEVVTWRNNRILKESLDSWRGYKITAEAYHNYEQSALELYNEYNGKDYNIIDFVTSVKNKQHGKGTVYSIANVVTLGIGTSMVSSLVESCERSSVAMLPVNLAVGLLKSPVYLFTKWFT